MPLSDVDLRWLMLAGGQNPSTVATLDERIAALSESAPFPLAKHGSHDQRSHGRRSARRIEDHKPELAERAFKGGATYDWRNETFTESGTMVALAAYEGVYSPPKGGWTEDALADSIVDWSSRKDVQAGLRSRRDAQVGSWLDPDSGNLFMDVSVVLPGAAIARAKRLAAKEDQLAFWVAEPGASHGLWARNADGEYVHAD